MYKILLFSLLTLISCARIKTQGPFEVHKDTNFPLVLSAPHCGFDLETEKIVLEISKELKSSSIIACGFRNTETPVNVNRPTEWKTEKETPKANEVFSQFSEQIKTLWHEGAIYIEIHGHHRPDSSLEIAQLGFDKEKWEKIQLLFEEEKEEQGLNIKLLFEGRDKLQFEAKGTKEKGTFAQFRPALHIEISSDFRKQNLKTVINYLSQVFSAFPEI